MADEVKVWEVTGNGTLKKVQPAKLSLEARIEEWIKQDISVLVPDGSKLLQIGQQVRTDLGDEIDLLCMDSRGNLVIVELKRDKTPRKVTAQALEYASWIQDLTADKIEELALLTHPGKPLSELFEETFDADYPEALNAEHSILIVAAQIDDRTERIIRYLSAKGIDINFVRFHLFQDQDGKELLIRTFTVAPDEAELNTSRVSNKNTKVRKTLEIRLKETSNEAERSFLEERLKDPQQVVDKGRIALLFRANGKTRFKARARTSFVHVIQIGRFPDDISYWEKSLSTHDITQLGGGTRLRLRLSSETDFHQFWKAMQNEITSFHWSVVSDPDAEDNEEELDEG
jgi:hypothetical protein